MKNILFPIIVVILLLCSGREGKATERRPNWPDSTVLAELDRSLIQSLDQMVTSKSFERQFQEIEEFLSVITDSCTRQHLALKCYDYYIHSQLNGTEAVAIMMVDSLFSPRKIQMNDEIELMNARIYAEFNRQTLLGKVAPSLTLYDRERHPQSFPFQLIAGEGKYSVLYFYSADCPKCKIETAMLCKMLEEENPAIRFYAIYTDDDFEKWQQYVAEDFKVEASKVEMVHLWDPQYESDFRQVYGVLQTPKMFFLDKQNVILGRSLDTYALKLMIHSIEELHPYIYGSEEADQSYEELFSNFQPELTLNDIRFFLSYTEKMFPKNDPQFKHTVGDLMFYLCRNRFRGSAYLDGAKYVADSLVQARPYLWTTETDSLQVISFSNYVRDLSAILPIGSLVPDLRLEGELRTVVPQGKNERFRSPEGGYARKGKWRLRKMKRPVYVVMYTEDCSNCKETLSIINDFMSKADLHEEGVEKMNFFLVNVGKLEKSKPALFQKIIKNFDLSFMPFLFQLDRNGLVLDKYIYL